ncbi:type II toxin-antitoxin system prevent-host-death family antitoxin [Variovorax ureilyticus]|uniref:type II toxin-antitoxin system prevent-host-death family antitoxin n=1 Tax=Variovorax ureilyticus TaxID=1836198 RepID=UPI003D668384
MATIRDISASAAKTKLGELLASLPGEGPVAITRNGRPVGILTPAAPPAGGESRNRLHLELLLGLYAKGSLTWRELSRSTGLAYGEVLVELGSRGLAPPRVSPKRRPEQDALFERMLRGNAEMKPLALIVTDSSPLITLSAQSALDALLIPGLPVIIPDMIRFEVVRGLKKPGAREVADWIRANETFGVRVASTEVFEEFEVLRGVNPLSEATGRGEKASSEVLARELENADFGAILVFEDSMVRKQNLLVRLPDEVAVTSTSEFLFGLERHGKLYGAQAILDRPAWQRDSSKAPARLR